jgi:hypothetical protein
MSASGRYTTFTVVAKVREKELARRRPVFGSRDPDQIGTEAGPGAVHVRRVCRHRVSVPSENNDGK